MSLPERGSQVNRFLVSSNRTGQVPVGVQGDAHIVVRVGVIAIPAQRLSVGMHRRLILTGREQAKAEELIRLCILRIEAERGPRFGNRVRAIIQTIEEVGQGPMVLRKTGHDPRRLCQLVISLIPFFLLAVDRTESEVQGGILWVSGQDLAHGCFSFVKVLLARLGRGLQQPFGNGSADLRRQSVSRTQHAHQVLVGAHGLHLSEFVFCGQRSKPRFHDQTRETAAGNSAHQPSGKLSCINRLRGGWLVLAGLGDDGGRQTEKQ